MWHWLQDLSCWLFHQPHSSEWWSVGVTAAAVFAAVWAGLAAYDQLGLLKDQIEREARSTAEQLGLLRQQIADARVSSEKQIAEMEAARKDVAIPYVVAVDAERWTGGFTTVRIRNVGPGPAISCRIELGTEPIAGEGGDLHERRRAQELLVTKGVLNREAEFDAIESNGERDITYTSESLSAYGGWKLGICRARFYDIYKREHYCESFFEMRTVGK